SASVQHERSPLFTTMSDGSVRNAYTLKIANKRHEDRRFELMVIGLEGADVSRVGGDGGLPVFTVGPDKIDAFHVFVTVPRDRVVSARDLEFVLTDTGSGDVARTDSSFQGPTR
ncbi:MAG: cytochrome c oxidase accessory protein CcoG, partial [Rhodospirillaceae bacterium]|nr:cytochrome c oxidase accessory protein CcoG [Rhodospirillaceae bacterium]